MGMMETIQTLQMLEKETIERTRKRMIKAKFKRRVPLIPYYTSFKFSPARCRLLSTTGLSNILPSCMIKPSNLQQS